MWPQSWESDLGLSSSVAQASLSPASAPLNHFPATAVIRGSTLPPSSPQGCPQSLARRPTAPLGLALKTSATWSGGCPFSRDPHSLVSGRQYVAKDRPWIPAGDLEQATSLFYKIIPSLQVAVGKVYTVTTP